jgi:PAS domain S-box-containing protein
MSNVPASATRLAVLVVDDIATSRSALCAVVEELGCEAIGADSGAAALRLVADRRPDVVLLDLLMPDLDGFEVTRCIRALVATRWLPVIVTSSLQGDEHFIHALESGADDYLVRPVNPRLLEAKLRHYARVLDLQARLETLAQRQRRIHDNILDAVITVDEAGTIVEANLAACRAFGSGEPASLRGRSCEAVLGAGLEAMRTGEDRVLLRADGSEMPVRITTSDWTDDGRAHCTLVVRDLAEQHRIDRMKDEFLATVSHELRTPLTSVLGALGLLAAGAAGPLPPAAVPLAEAAQRNGQRLSRLIDDILDLTKLEGDRLPMALAPAAIGDLLHEAHAATQSYAERAGVVLATDVDAAAGRIEVRVDALRFLQVMANLLSNAIKHSPAGDAVEVTLESDTAAVRVRVRDRGPGVDPAFRSRMFAKFSQADASDRRAQGGTGLGLYISRMLVERMGGRIGVEPGGSGGTVFIVELPRADAVPPRRAPSVLVVDSDVDARSRVAGWLGPLGDVDAVANLVQAEASARRRPPAVVIADTLAQGEADAFCTALHRLTDGGPVVLYSDAVDAAFAQSMGARWIRKSGTAPDRVLESVRAAIAARRVGRGAAA